jgi:ferredoxin
MVVESETQEVHEARRTALELLFSDHVGDCLSPCHRLCPLGLNIPVMIRHIQAEQPQEALALVRGTLPLAGVLGRLCHHPCEQGCRRGTWDDPAAIRDMERFATDWEYSGVPSSSAASSENGESPSETDLTLQSQVAAPQDGRTPAVGDPLTSARHPYLPPRQPSTGHNVAIVGAGPVGLAAAYYLSRHGHTVTLVDRRSEAGGSLRQLPESELPAAVLNREIGLLRELGVDLKLGVELGDHVTIDGLSRGFNAILVTVGEPAPGDMEKIGLPLSGKLLKADPNTCQTPLSKVFAAGAAVKPVKQLVRAMAEGRAAAECVNRFLNGQPVRRPEKAFSSVMGRLSPGELRQFLATASAGATVTPCDRCAGFNRREAATEAARCLHCDCRSSGNCVLQHYAQVYEADANRFRAERKRFEQILQPGGVIFEPGKCILCGICVKLTELAREPLGLTFIGRGFDVRVSAPLNHSIQEGLQKTAKECVKHCPTGALSFDL